MSATSEVNPRSDSNHPELKNREISVSIPYRDHWTWKGEVGTEKQFLQVKGCLECMELISKIYREHGRRVESWPLPQNPASHSEFLLKEMILKVNGKWNPPFQAEEICHCRAVPTETVLNAIKAGAHTTDMVSRWTSASTACGTCRPDVANLISYLCGPTPS